MKQHEKESNIRSLLILVWPEPINTTIRGVWEGFGQSQLIMLERDLSFALDYVEVAPVLETMV